MSDTDTDAIGEQLRAARQRRGLDLLAASRRTPLPIGALDRLERATGEDLGADVQLQAQLRMYARALGVDPEPLLRDVVPAVAPGADGVAAPARPVRRRRRRLPVRRVPVRRVPVRRALVAAGVVVAGALALLAVARLADVGEPAVRLTPPATPEPSGAEGAPATAEVPDVAVTPDPAAATPGRPPAETTVQLLDGARDRGRLAAARAALEELGYDIVVVDATAEPAARSVVYHTPGWEEEATALAAREGRLTHAGGNPGFTADAVLHVVVGRDWPQ